jgi:hypothetical protein
MIRYIGSLKINQTLNKRMFHHLSSTNANKLTLEKTIMDKKTNNSLKNITISDSCMGGYPCRHIITMNNNGKTTTYSMFGNDIYTFSVKNNLSVSKHFDQFKDFPIKF